MLSILVCISFAVDNGAGNGAFLAAGSGRGGAGKGLGRGGMLERTSGGASTTTGTGADTRGMGPDNVAGGGVVRSLGLEGSDAGGGGAVQLVGGALRLPDLCASQQQATKAMAPAINFFLWRHTKL
jgi:hypothetical protein